MKKIILSLALIAISVTAQSQTTVPQKVTGTVVATPTGTQAVSGTVSIANTPTNVNTTTSLSTADRGYIDGIEGGLTAINENTLTNLGVSSQITYTTAFVTKSSAGTLYGCFGYNSKTTGQFILFFNNTSIPADATAPFISAIYVPALSPFSFDTGKYGIPFSTGITWSNSSTPQTKTIGSSDIQITVIYK